MKDRPEGTEQAVTIDQCWQSTRYTGPATLRPRWNCKKADHFNINKAIDSFNQSIPRATYETIPRGAPKNYTPNRTEEPIGS